MHYNNPVISIGTVAEHLNISEGYLSHSFKKEMRISPLNYLTRYRIHQAIQMLKDFRMRVYEAAERMSYQDIAYFSTAFQKLTGLSPSDYQNQANFQ